MANTTKRTYSHPLVTQIWPCGRLWLLCLLTLLAGCSLLPDKNTLLDADADGFTFDLDCDDSNPAINPDASDTVDGTGTDQNCDGMDGTDADGDKAVSANSGGDDCDDLDSTVNPAAPELCDEVDNDCDGVVDEDDAVDGSIWYADQDDDGYGDASTFTTACTQPDGYVAEAGDCDDNNNDAYPSAEEVPYNGGDDDCNPSTKDDDLDDDGYNSTLSGGSDCNDADESVYPGASEICDDGVVNDCDGGTAASMASCGLGGTLSLSGSDAKFVGEEAGDNAGYALAGSGDMNGDGLGDLIVGAPRQSEGGAQAGAAYLLMGPLTGILDLSSAYAKFLGESSDATTGASVANAGDLDGDGMTDILIGAYKESEGGSNAGAVYVVLSPIDEGTSELSGSDAKIVSESESDYAGWSIASAGDVDGDEDVEIVVGAVIESSGGDESGAVYLVAGDASGTMSLSDAEAKLIGDERDDHLGKSVAGCGDVDGDGFDDLLAGAYLADAGGVDSGAAYILHGPMEGTMYVSDTSTTLEGEDFGDGAGQSVAGAGDVNNDGYADVLVGAWMNSAGGTYAGSAYLILGPAPTSSDLRSAYARFVGEDMDDYAGTSVAGIGDADGDEIDDIVVGAQRESLIGASSGAAYLILGPAEGTISLASSSAKLTGESAGDFAGSSVAGAGDMDADGTADILIGAFDEDTGGGSAGAAYLVLGGGY